MTATICYAATSGFLFQTSLSAIQARRTTPSAAVVVVHAAAPSEGPREAMTFRRVLDERGVELLTLDPRSLGSLSPIFARYYLDEVLPSRVDRVLYLDGDTQVLGEGTAAKAVVDPRVVHFMSQPRPWNASLPPWGAAFHAPYRDLVRDEPELSRYWQRFGAGTWARYRAQHTVKAGGSDAPRGVRMRRPRCGASSPRWPS